MSRKKEQTTDPPSEAQLTPELSLLMIAKADYQANGWYANAPYKLFANGQEFIGKIEERSARDPNDANKSITATRLVIIRPATMIGYELVDNQKHDHIPGPMKESKYDDHWVYDTYRRK